MRAGWASHQFKQKFAHWPERLRPRGDVAVGFNPQLGAIATDRLREGATRMKNKERPDRYFQAAPLHDGDGRLESVARQRARRLSSDRPRYNGSTMASLPSPFVTPRASATCQEHRRSMLQGAGRLRLH